MSLSMSGDKFLAWHEYSRIAQNCFGFNRNWDIPWQMVRSIMFESLQGNVWFMELIGHVARGPPIFWLQICHPQRWDGFFILNDRMWGKEETQWLAQLNSNWMRQAYMQRIWRITTKQGTMYHTTRNIQICMHILYLWSCWICLVQAKLWIRAESAFFQRGMKNGWAGKGGKIVQRRSESNPWLTAPAKLVSQGTKIYSPFSIQL